ncbi:ATP-NAD kinase-like domain-containing protein [Ephemerocybe angulata]|uniref:ATP-NAD kinase-like domain-containing protein n=1 Tax=Ephemerocybe angulata TaxID=980116 RepID=A0A8H6IJD6_9AGAR|nr:ATP-NAD kinase-like domain-containing protein [Tulosesus angulatus]
MPLIAIYNPACGDKTGKPTFLLYVLPLLFGKGITVDRKVETTHEGHAAEAVSEFAKQHSGSAELTIVLGSGDGTLHEVLNALYFLDEVRGTKINIVLVPCGTANALFSTLFPPSIPEQVKEDSRYRMGSVHALFDGKGTTPVSLAVTELKGGAAMGWGTRKTLVSAVVTSTALHAAILDTSEGLREEHPGLERFKMAAQLNVKKWFKARVRLLPAPQQQAPEIYDVQSNSFIPASHEGALDLEGPFAYFLSTINVDRLEPLFLITPLAHDIPPPPGTCDIVVIRPLRDPGVWEDTPETRLSFVQRTWSAMAGAYQAGAHLKLRYGEGGQLVKEGDGQSVVEYFRCGGWEWHPEPTDDAAHLVCSDGAINRIDTGGWASCRVSTTPEDRPTFGIYVE